MTLGAPGRAAIRTTISMHQMTQVYSLVQHILFAVRAAPHHVYKHGEHLFLSAVTSCSPRDVQSVQSAQVCQSQRREDFLEEGEEYDRASRGVLLCFLLGGGCAYQEEFQHEHDACIYPNPGLRGLLVHRITILPRERKVPRPRLPNIL